LSTIDPHEPIGPPPDVRAFRAFANRLPHFIWTLDRAGELDWMNAPMLAYLRLPLDVAKEPRSWTRVTCEGDAARLLADVERATGACRTVETELRLKPADAPDETGRWHVVRIAPAFDATGTLAYWLGTATDVHQQRATIDRRDGAIVAFAQAIPQIVWQTSADGAADFFNDRWYDFTGLPIHASVGDAWMNALHPDDVERTRDAWFTAVREIYPFEAEYRFRSRDGSYRWFLGRGVPMRDGAGHIVRWLGTCTDIQDSRDARDALLRELEREHRASAAFQQAALPASLPVIPGIRFHAVYSAAHSEALVGGDWYDVFRLSDGRVVLSIGDVSGSGLDAAVTMAGVRQAIRGAAQIYPDPVAVLDAADRALRSEQPDRIVTAFVAVFDPLTSNLTYASAGHPAPLVRRHDGDVIELTARGLPLGLRPARNEDAPRTVTIDEDSLVVFYTDGLIEATRDLIEGERLLHRALERGDLLDAGDPAIALLGAVVSEPLDDVAILTMHVGALPTERWSIDVSDGRNVGAVRRSFAENLRETGANDEDVITAELLFSELVGNVLRHSGGTAEVALDATGEFPVLHVLDRGAGFTFHARLPNDVMSESGRGLYIASMLARDLSVVPRPDGGSHARAVLPLSGTMNGMRPGAARSWV
jgi:PAS domain S-box-containing protein